MGAGCQCASIAAIWESRELASNGSGLIVLKTVGLLVVLLLLAAGPGCAQGPFASIRVGGHAGLNTADDDSGNWNLGVHGIARFSGAPIGISGGLNYFIPEDIGYEVSAGGQRLWLSAVVFPVGNLWYLGTGATCLRMTASTPGEVVTLTGSMFKMRPFVQTGLSLPVGRLTLFGEAQVLNQVAQHHPPAVHFLAGANLSM